MNFDYFCHVIHFLTYVTRFNIISFFILYNNCRVNRNCRVQLISIQLNKMQLATLSAKGGRPRILAARANVRAVPTHGHRIFFRGGIKSELSGGGIKILASGGG